MKQPSLLLAAFVALLILGGIVVALIALYKFTQSDFVLGVLGAVASVGLASYQFRKAKEREVEARLFSEKAAVYKRLIELIGTLFKQQKTGGADVEKLGETLQDIRTQLIIWGGSKTIQVLDSMGDNSAETDPRALVRWLASLYAEIRKDLGHKDKEGAALEIALGHVIVTDRHMFR